MPLAAIIHGPLHEQHDPGVLDTEAFLASDLESAGWQVLRYRADRGNALLRLLETERPDAVLPYDYRTGDGVCLHQTCEQLGLRSVLSKSAVLDRLLDKRLTKAAAREAGVAVLPDCRVDPPVRTTPDFSGPYIIKPLHGGDSRGIDEGSVVETPEDAADSALARATSDGVPYMIEQYFGGADVVERAVVAVPVPNGWRFANIEYRYPPTLQQGYRFLTHAAKKAIGCNRVEMIPCTDALADTMWHLTRRLIDAMGITGLVRAEFLSDGFRHVLLEINGIPGINQCFELAAEQNGLSRGELVTELFASKLDDRTRIEACSR